VHVVDETEDDMRALVERDFGQRTGPITDRDVLDWMHYRARLIPRRARVVTVSQEVTAQRTNHPAIGQLKAELERGGDVSPWLSDRVHKHKTDALADMMFNDWQISHFHLGRHFVSPTKVARGKLLLFALVKADRAVFLAINPHGAWTTTELLRILLRTSPQDMPEWKGALATQRGGLTDEELVQLRQAGQGYSIQIDGRTFSPPGVGISTSGHATRIVGTQFKRLANEVRSILRRINDNDLPRELLRQPLIVGVPVRLGIRLRDDGCLVLYEKARTIDLLGLPPFEEPPSPPSNARISNEAPSAGTGRAEKAQT
jgi:hypothetical protein